MNRTLALIKPDACERMLHGEIIKMICDVGINIIAMKTVNMTKAQAAAFYGEHSLEPFFQGLIAFMSAGQSIALVLEGEDVVTRWRNMIGATNPSSAGPDTIRGRFGSNIRHNVVHGSADSEDAAREVSFFFNERELV